MSEDFFSSVDVVRKTGIEWYRMSVGDKNAELKARTIEDLDGSKTSTLLREIMVHMHPDYVVSIAFALQYQLRALNEAIYRSFLNAVVEFLHNLRSDDFLLVSQEGTQQ